MSFLNDNGSIQIYSSELEKIGRLYHKIGIRKVGDSHQWSPDYCIKDGDLLPMIAFQDDWYNSLVNPVYVMGFLLQFGSLLRMNC
jgi:hypothetical protein